MGGISDSSGFAMSVRRFMHRRKYRRVDDFNGRRKRLRVVKLDGHKGRLAWKLKYVPILKLKSIKSVVKVSAKSWVSKLRDTYINMMYSLAQLRVNQGPSKMGVEDFNDKMIVEIYKSMGVQVQVLPDKASTRYQSEFIQKKFVI
ncbi:hypothetical protein SUGI_0113940 [Cryptomeria japonica]|nr:hypothetical protein SUGI_0113940 [Cryptomeria japonica]